MLRWENLLKNEKGNYVAFFFCFSHMLFINTRRFSAAGLQRSRCQINEGRKRGSATAAGDSSGGTECEFEPELNYYIIPKMNEKAFEVLLLKKTANKQNNNLTVSLQFQ